MKEKSKNIKFAFPSYGEIKDDVSDITAIYLRVSTDSQAQEGYGLDVQYNAIERYVNAYQLKNPVVFCDDGYTGVNEERPAFKKMQYLMSIKRVKLVVAYSLDRVGRTQMLILRFLKEDCVNAKCDFLAVKENIDSRNKQTYTILISILSMFAELDHDAIVTKLTLGREQRASEGHWKGGGRPPFGYKYSKEANDLVFEEENAEKVPKIFKMYIGGYSPRLIADIMGLSGDTAVFNILRNRTYLGEITFRGKQYKGNHTPLISEEIYLEAQETLLKNSKAKGSSGYLLSSLLHCGNCGAKMRYMKWGKSGIKIVCYSRFPSNKPTLIKDKDCKNLIYDAEEVEREVEKRVMAFSVRYSEKIVESQLIEGDIVKILENKLTKIDEEYKRCIVAFRKIGDESILEQAAELDRERKKTAKDIEDEKVKKNILLKVEKEDEKIRTLPSTWKNMTAKERQKIIKDIVFKIVLTDGNMKMVLNKTQYEIIKNSSES